MDKYRDERRLNTHILIVDDEQNIRGMIAALLAARGYTVSTAQDGFDAIEQLQHRVPDLIISDLNMPRMSGMELLKVVRHRFPEIALIAASGDYEDDRTPDGLVADAFYAKGSHQLKDLLRSVSQLTTNRSQSLPS